MGRIWMVNEDALRGVSSAPTVAPQEEPPSEVEIVRRVSTLAEGAMMNGVRSVLRPRSLHPEAGDAVDAALSNAKGKVLIAGVGLPQFFSDEGRHTFTLRRLWQEDSAIAVQALMADPRGVFVKARAALEHHGGTNLTASDIYLSFMRGLRVIEELQDNKGQNFSLTVKAVDYWPSVHLVITEELCFFETYHFGLAASTVSGRSEGRTPLYVCGVDSDTYNALRAHFEYLWRGTNPLMPIASIEAIKAAFTRDPA